MDENLLENLAEPWRSRCKALFQGLHCDGVLLHWESNLICSGVVTKVQGDELALDLHPFVASKGFLPEEGSFRYDLVIPELSDRHISLCLGNRVTCAGPGKADPAHCRVVFTKEAVLCPVPETVDVLPWQCVHLFAGGFCGWHHALKWISEANLGIVVAKEVAVDHCPDVMKVWSLQHSRPILRAPLAHIASWSPDPYVGILADVADWSILPACSSAFNLVLTMSPPCVSWSLGGLLRGLECNEGWAFIDSIRQIAVLQPSAAVAECADNIANHTHFAVIKFLMHSIGYRLAWEQIVDSHRMTHASRTRWMAVWVKQAASTRAFAPVFGLICNPRTAWSNEVYAFRLPNQLQHQLVLSCDEQTVYGDFFLLPPAKRAKTLERSLHGVLATRLIPAGAQLPTLCASYASQHLLAQNHVQARGIFAFLVDVGEGPQFLDPCTAAAMLGATASCAFPLDIADAFKLLGNAISVPQATLGLLVAFSAITKEDRAILELVGLAWRDRLLASHTVVFSREGIVWMQHIFEYLANCRLKRQQQVTETDTIVCTLVLHNLDKPAFFDAPANWTLRRFLDFATDMHDTAVQCIVCAIEEEPFDPHFTLGTIASLASQTRILYHSLQIGTLSLGMHEAISPTLPFHIQGSEGTPNKAARLHQVDMPSTEMLFRSQTYMRVVKMLERTNPSPHSDRKHWIYLAMADISVIAQIPIRPDASDACIRNLCSQIYPDLPHFQVIPLAVPLCAHSGSDIVLCANLHPDRSKAPVILEEQTRRFLLVRWIPTVLSHDFELQVGGLRYQAILLNCSLVKKDVNLLLAPGDVLTFGPTRLPTIRTGGHHENPTISFLPAGATFIQRCEFATNTNGWLGSDELEDGVQWIQWTAHTFAAFSGPAYWDTATDELRPGSLYEINFQNAPRAILPILADSHWCAVEVSRLRNPIQVTLHGFPPSLHTRIQDISARILGQPTSQLDFRYGNIQAIPHLCGWQLLFQWFRDSHLIEDLPDTTNQFHILHPVCQDLIGEVLQDSVLEWTAARAPQPLIDFALTLRRNYLVRLASDLQPHSTVRVGSLVASASLIAQTTLRDIIPRSINANPVDLQVRVRHFGLTPAWLASDELDFLLALPRASIPNVYFPPPARWCPVQQTFLFFGSQQSLHRHHTSICWLVLVQDHWVQLEFFRSPYQITLVHSDFVTNSPLIHDFRSYFAQEFNLEESQIECAQGQMLTEMHFCGWRLLHRIYAMHDLPLKVDMLKCADILSTSPAAEKIVQVFRDAEQLWQANCTDQELLTFVRKARHSFLIALHEGRGVAHYQAGGGKDKEPKGSVADEPANQGTASSSQAGKRDIIWELDPWAKKTKQSPTRWEELALPPQHPFVDEKGGCIQQTHRLQASHVRQGLVLTTKANLADMLKITNPNGSFALILPMTDLTNFGEVATRVQGPFEVVLIDSNLQTQYKRIIQLLVINGAVTYKLPEASHKFTADEHIEIVLELDSRLVAPKDYEAAKDQPLAYFRKLIEPACGAETSTVNLYGFRVGRHPSSGKGDSQLQCIAQVAKPLRATLLAYSGTHCLLARDYIDKSANATDTTILPRFWDANMQGLREASIVIKQTEGAAGLVLARRGIAVRCWISAIAKARRTVLAADNRITEDNIATVPRHVKDSTGWPPAVEPKHVIKAVLSATSQAPVPMRAYRSAGVHGWSLAFQDLPKLETFTVEINDKTFQILLSDPQPTPFNRAPKLPQPRSKTAVGHATLPPPPPAPMFPSAQQTAETQRIDRLEQRLDAMDHRQSKFETKLDSKFDEVSSILRQLVSQSSQRDRSPTGDTPPPKNARTN